MHGALDRRESGLAHECREIRADVAMRASRDGVDVVVREAVRHGAKEDAQDRGALRRVWDADLDLAVEAPGAAQGGVECIRAVRRGDHDDA